MNNAQLRRAMREMMKGRTNSSPPTLDAGDQYPAFKMMFNQHAQAIMNTKTQGLIHQYNEPTNERHVLYNLFELAALLGVKAAQDNPCAQMFVRKVAKVRFFGFTCEPHNLDKARDQLIRIINDMASSKWLIASLYNLGTLELASDPLMPGTKKFAIFSYLAVKPEHDADVDMTYSFVEFTEGGTPPEFK